MHLSFVNTNDFFFHNKPLLKPGAASARASAVAVGLVTLPAQNATEA